MLDLAYNEVKKCGWGWVKLRVGRMTRNRNYFQAISAFPGTGKKLRKQVTEIKQQKNRNREKSRPHHWGLKLCQACAVYRKNL